eukprot:558120-Pleurochrysis_carterae.AAC.1
MHRRARIRGCAAWRRPRRSATKEPLPARKEAPGGRGGLRRRQGRCLARCGNARAREYADAAGGEHARAADVVLRRTSVLHRRRLHRARLACRVVLPPLGIASRLLSDRRAQRLRTRRHTTRTGQICSAQCRARRVEKFRQLRKLGRVEQRFDLEPRRDRARSCRDA